MLAVEIAGHVARSPVWDCRECGEPWPCPDLQTIPSQDAWSYLPMISRIMPVAIRDLRGRPSGPDPIDVVKRFCWWMPLSNDEARAIALRMR